MIAKINQFIKENWLRIVQISIGGSLGITILFVCLGFLLVQTQRVGYFFSETDITIEITDKQTENVSQRRCEVRTQDGCVVYRFYTTTRYIIRTSSENFYTTAEMYNQLGLDQNAQVTVRGWRGSILPPRRIITFTTWQ